MPATTQPIIMVSDTDSRGADVLGVVLVALALAAVTLWHRHERSPVLAPPF